MSKEFIKFLETVREKENVYYNDSGDESPNGQIDNPNLYWFDQRFNLSTLPLSKLYDMQNWKLSDRQKKKIEHFIKKRASGDK